MAEPTKSASGPRIITTVIATWLTRRPDKNSMIVAMFATALLLLGSLITWSTSPLAKFMTASQNQVFAQGEFWRLWTTIFAHADFAHLASNSFLFFILGFFLYGHFGLRVFPFAAFFWGGLANAVVLLTYDPNITLLGASGVVYWMGGAWLVFYFALSRQKNLLHRTLRSLGVAIMLFMPAETFQPNVSHRTHFAGFCLGILFGAWHIWRNWDTFQSAEKKVTTIEEEDPGDQLPGPEGFPAFGGVTLKTRMFLDRAKLARIDRIGSGLHLRIEDARIVTVDTETNEKQEILIPVRVEFATIDTVPEPNMGPGLTIESSRLELETMELKGEWPMPLQYSGQVSLHLHLEETSNAGETLHFTGRGIEIFAAGPGLLI